MDNYNKPLLKFSDNNRKIRNCSICGDPIILRFIELFEKQNANSMLHWHRTLIKSGWMAFDVDNPGLIHRHRPKPRPKTEVVAA